MTHPRTPRPSSSRRRLALGAASVGVMTSLALSACSTPVPTVAPGAKASAPALTLNQDTALLTKVGDVLGVADKKRDPKALAQRLTGPALAIRTAELTVAKSVGKDDGVTELPTSVQTVVVSTTTQWPRSLMAVSTQPDKAEPPRLMALNQAGARDPYKLWGWARLFPGTTMPAFPVADVGTSQVAADDASLLLTPDKAVDQYLALLNKGDRPTAVKGVDPFRAALAKTASEWTGNADFKKADGTYTIEFTRSKSAPLAMRTQDGGAVVLAAATATEHVSAEKGAQIGPPNAAQTALFGKARATNKLTVTYQDVIALYVPPAGGDAVKVLGVEHVPVKVTTG